MRSTVPVLLAVTVAAVLLAQPRDRIARPELTPPVPPLRSGTIALAAGGSQIVTVNPDSGSISIADATTLTRSREIAVCNTPQSLSVTSSGTRAFVVCRDGGLYEVDLGEGRVLRSVPLGFDPFGVIATSTHLYVTVTGEHRVLILDSFTLATIASIATEEFPRGLALDGSTLYVTHFRSGRLSVVDAFERRVLRTIGTVADANLSQSVTVRNGRAYLPQTRANDANSALLFDTTVFPIVSVIDLFIGVNLNSERLSIDVVDRPSGIPIDCAITADGKIVVVHAASDDVSIVDLGQKRLVAHVDVGRNPRGVVLSVDQRKAFVNDTLSGTISVIDLERGVRETAIPVTTLPLAPAVLNGKILFHSSKLETMARDRWISCATCHFDGGTDGRTWFFRDGARNTTSLIGAGDTLPSHWSGDLDELQDVESTVRIIQAGSGLASGDSNCTPACDTAAPNAGRSHDLDDLAEFIRSLQPPPRSNVRTAAELRGRALFFDARTQCSTCHPAPLYTDRLRHDVGTATPTAERKGPQFDTPSLRLLLDTAPYLHNGSAPTLLDVVNGATGLHGDTRMLSAAEKADLAAFLATIPFSEQTQPRRRAGR